MSETADFLVSLWEKKYGSLNESGKFKGKTENESKALNNGLMLPFPINNINISPDYKLHTGELEEIAYNFAQCCIRNKASTSLSDEQDKLTYRDMFVLTDLLYNEVKELKPFSGETVAVNNGKNYRWYFSQLETGEYSSMNCMPTITYMAIKWLYKDFNVNPFVLRERYLLDGKGWFMSNVTDTLDDYNVKYKLKKAEFANIISDLDNGNIILTQMSKGIADASGHCMIIYGYTKRDSNYKFLCYDPDTFPYGGIFGNNGDVTIEYEADYAMFLIMRFTHEYLTIAEQNIFLDANNKFNDKFLKGE
jgi:hypothetical protein